MEDTRDRKDVLIAIWHNCNDLMRNIISLSFLIQLHEVDNQIPGLTLCI